jgi:hypothetical protein
MTNERLASVTEILIRTTTAHSEFEKTVLKGVYDEAWADWYAEKALEYGFNEALGSILSAAALSKQFTDLNEERKKLNPELNWAAYTAKRLVELFDQ